MKELKISISDELYEELSNVPDKDSFLIELLENKLKGSAGNNAAELTGVEGTGEELPEEAYFELEDTFEEEGSMLVPVLKSSTDEEDKSPIENMACFQSIIVDLADRICELEKQISDMSSNVQFLKDRSVLSDIGDKMGEAGPASAARSDSIVTERPEGAVPYATLSFPELKIPPELLSDDEGPVAGIEHDDVVESPMRTPSQNVPETTVAESPFPEPSTKPLLFAVETSSLTSPQTPTVVPEQEFPSFLQNDEIATDTMKNDDVGEHASQATKPEIPVTDVNAPAADRLESCIFAYLRSGSEVKKDVIKSLLSRRYPDTEVESKIDQLLAAGRISNIVKDGRVYLMRLPEKKSA